MAQENGHSTGIPLCTWRDEGKVVVRDLGFQRPVVHINKTCYLSPKQRERIEERACRSREETIITKTNPESIVLSQKLVVCFIESGNAQSALWLPPGLPIKQLN